MRKLSVILLAILLVLGFGMQAGAEPTGFDNYDDVGFSGSETLLDFEDPALVNTQIGSYYEADGVIFSEGLVGMPDLGFWNPRHVTIATNYYFGSSFDSVTVYFTEPVTHVGFDVWVQSANFSVTVYRDDSDVPSGTVSVPVPREYTAFIGVVDPEGIDHIVIGSAGQIQIFAIDDFRFEGTLSAIEVRVDIQPGSCLNPLNIKRQGVLHVAIIGTEELDVAEIDPSTVLLAGVSPLRDVIEDRIYCNGEHDGIPDLTLKFEAPEIVQALGDVQDGDLVTLQLTGQLYDGTEITGSDVVTVLARGKYRKHWKKRWKGHWKGQWKEQWQEHKKEYWEEHGKEQWKEKMEEMKTEWKAKGKK